MTVAAPAQPSAGTDFQVDYDHRATEGIHTVEGAREALRIIFPDEFPRSVLDVGCGSGTWLRAALERGAAEVLGVEGAEVPQDMMRVPHDLITHADLNQPFNLHRRFELVMCLETAEHLEPESAETLVESLVRHGDTILFSAAIPGQPGIHHVNCQWPSYWQRLFNGHGFVCSDAVRWLIWDNGRIEPWYRQNLMIAKRDAASAGTESRIVPVAHPDLAGALFFEEHVSAIEAGALPWRWYLAAPYKAAAAKLQRAARRAKPQGRSR